MTTGCMGNPSPETSSSLLLATPTGSELHVGRVIRSELHDVRHVESGRHESRAVTLECIHRTLLLPHMPPCRHSEDMIEKLESAGLGFYVRATETQQKLGTK